MAAGSTYTQIASFTVSTAQASYTFSSISGAYTDLRLVIQGRQTGAFTAQQIKFYWNGDTGTNYSETLLSGNGTSASSSRDTNLNFAYLGSTTSNSATANEFGLITVDLMNYSNTTTYKTVLSRTSIASVFTASIVSLWRNTSAINSIGCYADTANFAPGTTFALYGITAA